MRIYIAYKFTGADKSTLKSLIEIASKKLESLGHTTFCFYRDIQDWGSKETARTDVFFLALKNLDTCDAVVFIIDEEKSSTGMGIEAGYAKAKNKKIFLAVRNGVQTDYISSLSENSCTYTSLEELERGIDSLLA